MREARLVCMRCGHAWREPIPRAPRLLRASVLAVPMVLGAALAAPGRPGMWVLAGVGGVVGVLAYRLCTPACPACQSTRTRRHSFRLDVDARVLERHRARRR